MNIKFLKCHGSSNHFILIDEEDDDYHLQDDEMSQLAIKLCNKDILGADGVLFFLSSNKGDALMRIFNADGSEAEMCGNGIRCIARYGTEKFDKETLLIETLKSTYNVKHEDPLFENIQTYSVKIDNISKATVDLPAKLEQEHIDKTIPELNKDLRFTALSLTNPHIVALVNDFDETLLQEVGVKANDMRSLFPRGVNVSFCIPRDDGSIFVGTYERGVGLTNSCGTAMSASSIVMGLLEKHTFGTWMQVFNKGGMVRCKPELSSNGLEVTLLGNATYVCEGEIAFARNSGEVRVVGMRTFTDEVKDYKEMLDFAGQIDLPT
ncbi:MAG: diaminopimelate epimerase [Bacteroidetes bacterium]|nr:diaminopimelate epimerase [Bacteroidota bacterium]